MNGHDFTREQNMEARMTLAAARRGLAAAINDAVEIAKKYEDEKVVSFINGILGAFVRAEFPEQGRPKAASDPKEA